MDPVTLQALRRNDPDQSFVELFLQDFTNERLVEFVAVMQQNTFADDFHINLGGVNANENFEVEPLIDLLQNRRVLERVSLWGPNNDAAMIMGEFVQRILRRMLQAVARRACSIQFLRLRDFPHVPIEEMVSIIGGRFADGNGLYELKLSECGFRPTPGYNMEQLENAFRQNTSLKVMGLCITNTTPWLVPIRGILRASTSVEKLKLECRNRDANASHSEALGELLAATSTNKLKEVSFLGFYVGAEIPRSIAENEKIECIDFGDCEFSEDAADLLCTIITKSRIKKLGISTLR